MLKYCFWRAADYLRFFVFAGVLGPIPREKEG
jgi:hypothetical protein